jgi:hypothetical protein
MTVVCKLTLLSDDSDLGSRRSVNELSEVETADTVNKTKVQTAKLETRKLELVKDSSLSNGEHGGQLLELKERLDAELVGGEEIGEDVDIEVVLNTEGLELDKVELVNLEEVVEINLAESKLTVLATLLSVSVFAVFVFTVFVFSFAFAVLSLAFLSLTLLPFTVCSFLVFTFLLLVAVLAVLLSTAIFQTGGSDRSSLIGEGSALSTKGRDKARAGRNDCGGSGDKEGRELHLDRFAKKLVVV